MIIIKVNTGLDVIYDEKMETLAIGTAHGNGVIVQRKEIDIIKDVLNGTMLFPEAKGGVIKITIDSERRDKTRS